MIWNWQNFSLVLWLCISASLSFSSKAVDCTTDTIGLCSPTIEEIIEQSVVEEIQYDANGYTITTTTTNDITTTTVTNENSNDLLNGDNGYVVKKFEGDMDSDWGGQGSASMPSGSGCGELGTDKCASITSASNYTSTMGVPNAGTTFIQTVDISALNITYGGETNYTIKVDKQDAQDSIYMHITGKNGSTNVFSGTDILSASGTASGYQSYEGGFDFSGSLTTVIIEIGGRDINLSIGPLFDDVSINVLYNVINTIITQSITSVEMFVALNIDAPEDVVDVVEDIFDNNEMNEEFVLEPIEIQDANYEAVEIEIQEIEMAEIEIEVMEMEMEVEAEIEMEIQEAVEEVIEVAENTQEEEVQEQEAETEEAEEKVEVETKPVEEKQESNQETKSEDKKEIEKKPEKESSKEKAVKKIMKKMDDKKRYDDVNQTKTLVVMQVLGDSKTFFDTQQALNDRVDFFSNVTLPDTTISDNSMASYFLFAGSDGLMNELVDSQWQN
jgi:outer membrane biosynthesis protein TonB